MKWEWQVSRGGGEPGMLWDANTSYVAHGERLPGNTLEMPWGGTALAAPSEGSEHPKPTSQHPLSIHTGAWT